NYHNLYRGDDGKWRWRWDINLLQWRRLNSSAPGDLYTYLQQIHCPTLLIRGQRSPLLTPEVAEKMIQALPHGRTEELANGAHTANDDSSTESNAATAAFLKE